MFVTFLVLVKSSPWILLLLKHKSFSLLGASSKSYEGLRGNRGIILCQETNEDLS